MASGCDHVDHVRTQLPYALVVAFVDRTRVADRVWTAVESFRAGWPAEDDATALVVTVR